MGKVLQFKRMAQVDRELKKIEALIEDVDDEISSIVNDYSLTPANRHWLLENMLMDIDEKLEWYKQELERAERKLELLVITSEKDIEAAYNEYIANVKGMTQSVKKLTRKMLR